MAMTKPIYVLNGPNLNLLGLREPEIYGSNTLADVKVACETRATAYGLTIEFRQSNHEGDLIGWIQEARTQASAVILNAASFTHTSIGLHDALKTLDIPAIEVHLSNPHKREAFRHHSYVTPVVQGVIAGFAMKSYVLAVEAAAELIDAQNQ
jgi:3-dehydroquinate dehydratase II